jgi:hypothetical protein
VSQLHAVLRARLLRARRGLPPGFAARGAFKRARGALEPVAAARRDTEKARQARSR